MRNPLPPETVFERTAGDGGYALYFGRLSPEKGVKTLICAARSANVPLLVLGTGPIEGELKEFAKDMKNVTFGGFRQGKELTDSIAKAKCVVLPSEWYENGPYSAMEAMALGKPLIVSDNGGLPELVENGVNGYIFSGERQLGAALKSMFALPDPEYEAMCASSLDKAKTLFDWKSYIEKLIELQAQYRG